jgi:hypothetical protein
MRTRPETSWLPRPALPLLGAALVFGMAGCGPSRSAGPSGDTEPSATTSPGGSPSADGPAGINLVDEGYAGRFRAYATVLEKGNGGPQLCLGGVATSLPPQCGGPPVVGWQWAKIAHEEAAGVRWGSFVVVGHFDGKRFTLTEPARPDDGTGPRPASPALPDFRTPCPAPSGGWVPVDPAGATEDALQRATGVAEAQSGYAALWIDQNETATATGPTPGADNDPARIILNVSTTGDVAAMRQALRAVWGGNLCVSKGRRTDAELRGVQSALDGTPGMLSSSADTVDGWVDLTVVLATTLHQRQLDAAHGPGVVRLIGALEPLD